MCLLSATYEGRTHDKCIADLAGYTLPPGSCFDHDTGFQSFLQAGVTMFRPKKYPVGVNSPPPEKANNRGIASTSIRIEHAIGAVKRYSMVKDNIRLLKDGIRDIMMETCCGIHNFRLLYRPWHYTS
jgi:hypothetical protein